MKAWSIYQENESLPAFICANSLKIRNKGMTIVADGTKIEQSNKVVKIVETTKGIKAIIAGAQKDG